MPIAENDPWRMQYFEGVACPDDVLIPTEDPQSYRLYPQHRWIYNKLLVAESQGLACGPHGITPDRFPVFSKPVYNLRGMGIDTRILRDAEEYAACRSPGHMWMPVLTGEHVSTDVTVVDGAPQWWRHSIGAPLGDGMFDYWTILADPKPALEEYVGAWIRRHVRSYTGMLNVETIGGTIIEAHLRFADQWPDLYGPGWVRCVVALYVDGVWEFPDSDRRPGYSVVLFGPHGAAYRQPAAGLARALLADSRISSVQYTFFEDRAPALHAMPPGGFRLAIVNCWDLEAGRGAREQIARHFGVATPSAEAVPGA